MVLPAVVFVYNDTPRRVTGYSSHKLIFGAPIIGPFHCCVTCGYILMYPNTEHTMHICLISDNALSKVASWQNKVLRSFGKEQREYCKKNRKLLGLKPKNEMLILLPDKSDTLLTSWQGPFSVIKHCSPVNYLADVNGNHKLFHINMLKQYYSGSENQLQEISTVTPSTSRLYANSVSL